MSRLSEKEAGNRVKVPASLPFWLCQSRLLAGRRERIFGVPRHFIDDDNGYLAWLDGHRDGFVINCERDPKPNYVILHRASCGTITGTPSRGVRWTKDFRKVCAGSAAELDDWAEDAIGGRPSRCGRCAIRSCNAT